MKARKRESPQVGDVADILLGRVSYILIFNPFAAGGQVGQYKNTNYAKILQNHQNTGIWVLI